MKRQLDNESREETAIDSLFFLSLPIVLWSQHILGKAHFPDYAELLLLATVSRQWQWLVYGQVDEIDLKTIRFGSKSGSIERRFSPDPIYASRFRNVRALTCWDQSIHLRADESSPISLSRWATRLTYLSVTGKRLSRCTQLPCLQATELDGDTFRLMEKLSRLTNLTELHLIRLADLAVEAEATFPDSLTKLELLDCTFYPLRCQAMLARLTNLRSLCFVPSKRSYKADNGNGINYKFLSSLLRLESLRLNQFSVSSVNMAPRAEAIDNLALYVPRLEALRELAVPAFCTAFPASLLGQMTRLTSLHIGYRRDTGDVEALRQLTNLTHLDFFEHRGGVTLGTVHQLMKDGPLGRLKTFNGNIC